MDRQAQSPAHKLARRGNKGEDKMDHLDLLDAYDDAHTLRKQLAHDLKSRKNCADLKKRLSVAMQAEENARIKLEQFERSKSGLWS